MGNRGILHNEKNEVIRPWAHKGWVTCRLNYKEVRRPKPFSAGSRPVLGRRQGNRHPSMGVFESR